MEHDFQLFYYTCSLLRLDIKGDARHWKRQFQHFLHELEQYQITLKFYVYARRERGMSMIGEAKGLIRRNNGFWSELGFIAGTRHQKLYPARDGKATHASL